MSRSTPDIVNLPCDAREFRPAPPGGSVDDLNSKRRGASSGVFRDSPRNFHTGLFGRATGAGEEQRHSQS
jgi:hypothetical protein